MRWPSEKWPLGVLALALLSTVRTCSRPMPYLFSAVGFSSTRTAGQRTAAHDHLAHAAHLRQLLRHDGGGGVVHLALAAARREVSASMKMGESAGFTLR